MENNIKELVISAEEHWRSYSSCNILYYRLYILEQEIKKLKLKQLIELKDLYTKINVINSLIIRTLVTTIIALIGIISIFLKS